MRIQVELPYDLDNRQVQQVFQGRLEELRHDHFIKDGWVYRVEEGGHGSPWDEKVAEVGHPDVELIVTAIKMQELTKDICPNRTQGASYGAVPNHRMLKSVGSGYRCVDCGHYKENMK